MATFSIELSQANVTVNGTDSPITPNSEALTVVSSRVNTPYQTSSGSWVRSPNAGLAYIPAASLPSGATWLVYYQASVGSSSSSGMVDCYFVARHSDGNDTPIGHVWAECTGHGSPIVMNGSHMAGMTEWTSNGTDSLEFFFKSTTGLNPIQVGGTSIVAIRVDDLLTKSQSGGDYWYYPQQNSSHSFTSATYIDIVSTTYTPTVSEDFWLVCSSDVMIPFDEYVNMRVTVDGQQVMGQWVKGSADSRDTHNFFLSMKIPLSGGVAHSIKIQGKTGTNAALFSKGRITLLKLSSFSGYAYRYDYMPSVVYSNYPAWQQITTDMTYSPSTTGEYVFVVSNGSAFRDVGAATMARLKNVTTGQAITEFTSTAHPSVTGGEATVLTCGAAELISAPNTYRLEITNEPGYDDAKAQGYAVWPQTLMVLGLSKVTGPENVFLSGSEQMLPFTETPGGDLEGQAAGSDDVRLGDDGAITATVPSDIPLTHPRLWTYGTNRLAYWQAQYAGNTADWLNFIDPQEYGDYPWHYAMRYIVTGDTTYRDQCFAALTAELAARPIYSGALATNQWQEARQRVRSWALCYDWLYSELSPTLREYLEDSMLATVYVIYHPNKDAICLTIYPGADPTDPKTNAYDEGVNQPLQNFCSTYHFIAMYAAAALYPNKTTFRTIPGNNSSPLINFEINFNYKTPGQGPKVWYTDLVEFVRDRLDYKIYPVWQTYWKGGGWNEGSAYGVGVGMFQGEAQALFSAFGWGDLYTAANRTFYHDVGLYNIYQSQPRNLLTISYGEAAGTSPFAAVANYMRHSMLGVAYNYSDPYIQWWLDNVFPAMGSSETDEWRSLDLLMGKRGQTATDYRDSFPLHYHSQGTGFFNSRSSWADTATSVTLRCGCLVRDHADEDINSLMLFKSYNGAGSPEDAFSLCDPAHFYESGTHLDNVQYHNTYTLYESTLGVLYPWRQRFTDYSPANNPNCDVNCGDGVYAYAKGDGQDIYWQLKNPPGVHGGTIRVKINDVFQREMFHVKLGSYVVVYDRFRVLPAFIRPDTNAQARWHWPHSQPVSQGGGVYRHDNRAGGRVYAKFFDHDGITFTNLTTGLTNVWQQKVDHFLNIASDGVMGDFTVFEIPDTPTKSSMTLVEKTQPSLWWVGDLGSTMAGVTIKESSYINILFSAEADGSTPSTISYAVPKLGSSDKHYVCNLAPGQEYLITETDLTGGYFKYTLTPTFNNIAANDAGVLEFQPSDIGTQPTWILRGSEIELSLSDTGSQTPGWTNDGSDPMVPMVDSGKITVDGAEDVTLSGQDEAAVMFSDSGGFIGDLDGGEPFSLAESGRLLYTAPDVPPPTYVEKKIFRGNVAFYPNDDLGLTYFTKEPDDAPYSSIMADEDDNTFIKTVPGAVFGSNLSVGLDDPAGFNGTIRTIRFKARIRYCSISGVNNPTMVCNLYKSDGTRIVQSNIALQSVLGPDVLEVESPPLAVSITTDDMRGCYMRIQFRAFTYPLNYSVELSSAWIETTGRINEKVITAP